MISEIRKIWKISASNDNLFCKKMKLPQEILDFGSNNNELDLALIGCRADSPDNSYDCCEYDIAILGGNIDNNFDKKIIQLGKNTLEFLNFQNQKAHSDISLFSIMKLSESNSLVQNLRN